ncbi:MAG: hypothetical protein GXP32_04835 [Kiritimatiellaeota bacterium]|nr:hypothetical protein [Kiritimatiellota bacterium]
MPLIKTVVSVDCEKDKKEHLALALSKVCADGIGKPESYVASIVEDNAVFAFGGAKSDAVFVEVRSIGGLNGEVNAVLSEAICGTIQEELGIPGDRVYINFIDIAASDWGWNGGTFG